MSHRRRHINDHHLNGAVGKQSARVSEVNGVAAPQGEALSPCRTDEIPQRIEGDFGEFPQREAIPVFAKGNARRIEAREGRVTAAARHSVLA